MILIDTSVLIDWLKGKETPETKIFDKILNTSTPFGISALTYQEILQNAKDEDREKLRSYLGTQIIYHLPHDMAFFDIASDFCSRLRRSGKAVCSTIYLLIAATAVHYDLKLLHSDKGFDILASEINELEILEY